MTIDQQLQEFNDQSLIEIIEQPEFQGTPKQAKANQVLDSRNLPLEQIKDLALIVNETIAYELIMKEGISKEEVTLHQSHYLNVEEIKNIYIDQLEKYIKQKDQFRFDVWSYAIGGI